MNKLLIEMAVDLNYKFAVNYKINKNKTKTSKSFEYKTKIIGCTPVCLNRWSTEVVFPSKGLSNFSKFVNLPFINCEIELDLTWPKICVISETSGTLEVGATNPVDATQTTGATFK